MPSACADGSRYATVANEGVWLRRTSWRRSARFSAPRTPLDVLSLNVARQVMAMMRDVVVEGTGQRPCLPGYQVAGKTGTAAKPDASVATRSRITSRRSWASFPRRTSYRRPRHDRRAARRDLGRHRRGSGLRRHRPLRAQYLEISARRARRSPLGNIHLVARLAAVMRRWTSPSLGPPRACPGRGRPGRRDRRPRLRQPRGADRGPSSSACRVSARTGTNMPRSSRGRRRCARRDSPGLGPVPQIVVMDVREAMAHWPPSSSAGRRSALEVAAVTGTNGKTTTSFLLYSILEAAGRKPGLLGRSRAAWATSAGQRFGRRPRRSTCSALSARCWTPAISAPPSRPPRTAPSRSGSSKSASPFLVFTNLSQDHLDFHGTMEAYWRRSDGCSSTASSCCGQHRRSARQAARRRAARARG